MAFPPALKEKVEEKEEVREGEAEAKKGKKKTKKAKVDTEIIKGGEGAEGVTKMNDPRKKGQPSLDAVDPLSAGAFKTDGCGCKKKDSVKADGGSCSKKGKKKSVWADGFGKADAEFVLTAGADKLATEKYAREKRKRNAQGQPHNYIYANTFNT